MAILLKIGDKVSFLQSTGNGTITAVENSKYCVKDEFGFENWHSNEEIVPLMVVSEEKLFATPVQKKIHSIPSKPVKLKAQTSIEKWKIDLHIENLIDSHNRMSNHEILTLQLKSFKSFLQNSRSDRATQILVVHGVGTGRLKSELKEIVKGINGAEMFDADYLGYGKGASIIEQKYNIR